jgi:hypothetical protein
MISPDVRPTIFLLILLVLCLFIPAQWIGIAPACKLLTLGFSILVVFSLDLASRVDDDT